MRLIDADALANYANNQIVGITANDIMRFPTVDAEPVKHGRRVKAKRIIEHYGAQHQLVKLCEECAELTQQAVKCYDAGMEYSCHLVEEMADVKVMLMQFESIMIPEDRELLEFIIAKKLDRQIGRIKNDD